MSTPLSPPDPPPSTPPDGPPVSRVLTSVPLTVRADDALDSLTKRLHLSPTDVVNRALQVYQVVLEYGPAYLPDPTEPPDSPNPTLRRMVMDEVS